MRRPVLLRWQASPLFGWGIVGLNLFQSWASDPVAGRAGQGTDGWGESSVDEIVAALETLYTDTQQRKRIASCGAAWILQHRRTWSDHAAALKTHLLQLI